MRPRSLSVAAAPLRQGAIDALLPILGQALDGEGPALAPLDPTVTSVCGLRHRPASGQPEGLDPALVDALRPDEPLERDDVSLVLPTSGSTGAPKGVLLTAAALRSSARATHTRLGGPGHWLLALSPTRIAGLQVLVRSLHAGTEPVVLEGRFDPSAFVSATARLNAGRRYTALVPTQLDRLLGAGPGALTALRSYDAVLVGGAAAPDSLTERAAGEGVHVVRTYGMTETSGGCVYDGAPLDGVDLAIDEEGRVRVAGPVLFVGYRGRPDLTREALVDGWHITPDLGRLHEDGRLEVLGRVDDVAISGGMNVPLLAVERAVAELPGVLAAAAVGVPDPAWGERVVVYVVLRPGTAPLSLERVRDHVASRHPRAYAPRDVVVLPDLPMLASGKPDRLALRARTA